MWQSNANDVSLAGRSYLCTKANVVWKSTCVPQIKHMPSYRYNDNLLPASLEFWEAVNSLRLLQMQFVAISAIGLAFGYHPASDTSLNNPRHW